MNFARAWYLRFRGLVHEVAKFGIVGVIGLVVTDGGYILLNSKKGLALGPLTSLTIATIVATVVTYLGNRYWSFRHRERTNVAREGVVFAVLNGLGILIQLAIAGFLDYVVGFQHGLEQFIAANISIAIATLFRWWSYRRFVWAAPAEKPDPPARAVGEHLGYDDWAVEERRAPAHVNGHSFQARSPQSGPSSLDN